MDMELMAYLRDMREKKNITQQQIADELGVKKNTISNYENGVSEPSLDAIYIMCNFYGIDFSDTLARFYKQSSSPSYDKDIFVLLQSLKDRPAAHMLMSTAITATDDDIIRAAKFLDAMQKEDGED